jgi:uncharacterized repeat protein (TIGR01451 family)
MLRTPHSPSLPPATAIISLVFTVLLAGFLLAPTQPSVRAEGSRDLINNAGNRAYLEYHATAQTAGIPRQTQFLVYAENGETINLGSSAMSIGAGNIEVVSPDGTIDTTCEAQRIAAGGVLGEYGVINTRAEEVAGPLPNAAGYTPCIFAVTAATEGIWTVRFTSPNPTDNVNNNPPVRLTTANWTQPATTYWIVAWDITVRNGAAAIDGRTFTTYLAMNMGANNVRLRANVYILTIDGYIYRVDMNGLDPFGFIFFANTEGFTNSFGQSAYRSIQFQGGNTNPTLPAAYGLHSPAAEDAPATNDITHLIFFDVPDPNLPEQAPFYDEVNNVVANTWLRLLTPTTPLSISNFAFTGIEGTPGRMGTAPLGGNFTFDATKVGGVSIQIDVNADGDFIDPVDRTFTVPVVNGTNQVYWDGLDGTGAPVSPGAIAFAAQIIDHYGEVHFPFFDAEQNIDGISIQRIRDAGTTLSGSLDPYLVYYNDTYNYSATTAYDFTICGTGETPAPPASALVAGCNGTPPTPRSALAGVNSEVALPGDTTGAHNWASSFGDRRGIDTWVFYPANPVDLALGIQVREADLAIVKSHIPATPIPGGPITYSLVVTNNGPSDAQGLRVRDIIPSSISNVTWSCAISTPGTGACGAANGSGNVIDTTLDLNNGAVAVYTVQGTLSASASGTIVNTAEVVRPPDLSDPNPNNNRSTDTLTVGPAADLELNKTFAAPIPSAIGDPLTFQITLRNRGPNTANNVTVTDQLPPEVTFISSTASRGSYNPATGIWTVGSIAKDEVLTLLINTTLNAVAVTNVAQVSGSDVPDPDSTPGNNNPNEDDQGSSSLPIPVADVRLSKVVNSPVVNLGSNAIFTIVLTNDGPETATGVEVTDRLPIGLSFVNATVSQGSYDPISGLWQVGTVLNGASASLTLEVKVEGVGPFTNTAEVSDMDQFDIDSTPNNGNPGEDDQASATVGAALADLALSKTVNTGSPLIGEVINYTVTLRNDGPSDTTGVAVSEQVPVNLQYISHVASAGTSYDPVSGIWTVGALANGGTATLTMVGSVLASPITNLAQVSASNLPDPDSTPGNGNPNEDDQASLTIPSEVDLALTKQLINPPNPPRLGDQVTFAVQVTNQYSTTATGVQVTDRLPSGLEYLSSSASQGSYDPISGVWNIGTVPPGASVDLIVVTRLVATGNLRNVAEISRCDQRDIDSIPNSGAPEADDLEAVTLAVLPAAITLLGFDAAYTEGGAVALSWTTGIELNTAGFVLYRSADGTRASALRITPAAIVAQGSAAGGASYRFIDLTVRAGERYSYWLREVEAGGVSSEYGPVSPQPRLNAGSQRVYLPMTLK